MKIAIFGTGAVGGYFGGLLSLAGHEVSFIARGAHLEAIRQRGLVLRYIQGDKQSEEIVKAPATDNPAEIGPVDYVLFGVKAYETVQAGQQLQPLIGENTAIITIQNGLDSPQQLATLYGKDKIMTGAARIEITLGEPGVVIKYGPPRGACALSLAEMSGERTERLEKLVEAFQSVEIATNLSTDPLRLLWTKYLVLAPTAGLLTVARAHGGEVYNHEPTKELYPKLIEEAAKVASAEGIEFEAEALEKSKHPLFPADTAFKSSLQRDFEKGKPTEVEELIGAMVRRGKQYGIATPHFDTIYALLSLAAKVGYRYNG